MTPTEIIDRADFPQFREKEERKWLKFSDLGEETAKKRLILHAARLQELNMPDEEIEKMLSDIYWDALEEFRLGNTIEEYTMEDSED